MLILEQANLITGTPQPDVGKHASLSRQSSINSFVSAKSEPEMAETEEQTRHRRNDNPEGPEDDFEIIDMEKEQLSEHNGSQRKWWKGYRR
jgi:hypothetical protein